MDCTTFRQTLTQADDLEQLQALSAEAAIHLRSCPSCQAISSRLQATEAAWRSQPLPARVDQGKEVFLRRLDRSRHPRRLLRTSPRHLLVAAAILLALGLGSTWVFWPTSTVQGADLVDRLVEWNLDLSERDSHAARAQLYAELATAFRAELHRTNLAEEDHALAEHLLDTGAWLVKQEDPLEEADRFNVLADRLFARTQSASAEGDDRQTALQAQRYTLVVQRGVQAKIERMGKKAGLSARQKQKLEQLGRREKARQAELETLEQQLPRKLRKAIRRQQEETRKRHRPKDKVGR